MSIKLKAFLRITLESVFRGIIMGIVVVIIARIWG